MHFIRVSSCLKCVFSFVQSQLIPYIMSLDLQTEVLNLSISLSFTVLFLGNLVREGGCAKL